MANVSETASGLPQRTKGSEPASTTTASTRVADGGQSNSATLASSIARDESANLRIPRDLMPDSYRISLANSARGGTDRMLLHPPTQRIQPMRGFEPQYVDIIDYIVRITHRIWEQKDIGYIYDTYRHNSKVTDDSGLQYGRDKIVADTVHTINAFADIRLYADEIVWAGNEEVGFFTSHRTVITGTNTGWSRFGPPTHRRITVWCIANCVSLNNEIFEEWVIYNQSSMLRQLGFDLAQKAAEMGNARIRTGGSTALASEPGRVQGQGKPRHLASATADFDIEAEIHRAYHYAWNWRNLSALDRFYDEGLVFHGPTDRELRGLSGYKAFILSIIAMFPDIALKIDEVYWMGNGAEGFMTSVRWSAVATHRGFGPFGPPTGRPVRIWGITQHRIVGGTVREEWMMFNELDLLQQIYAAEPI